MLYKVRQEPSPSIRMRFLQKFVINVSKARHVGIVRGKGVFACLGFGLCRYNRRFQQVTRKKVWKMDHVDCSRICLCLCLCLDSCLQKKRRENWLSNFGERTSKDAKPVGGNVKLGGNRAMLSMPPLGSDAIQHDV